MMYMQIGRDIAVSSSYDEVYDGYGNYTRPITADGFHDRVFESNPVYNDCVQWGNTWAFTKINENPFTGGCDQEHYSWDTDNDNYLKQDNIRANHVELHNSTYNKNLYMLGHSSHVFTLSGNKKLGVGTNPSSASMMNIVSNNLEKPGEKNIRKIYLNGISIEILSVDNNHNITVRIKFNDVDIDFDTRWCADEIVLPYILGPGGNSLNLKSGKTILLDQGTTATRMNNPITFNGQQIFASPTVFRCTNNTVFNMEQSSTLKLDNNSKMYLETGSTLIVSSLAEVNLDNNSEIIVQDGASMEFKSSANLVLNGESKITVEEGGLLILGDGVNVSGNLDDKILIYGNVQMGENIFFNRLGSSNYFSGIYFYNEDATINISKATFTNSKFHNYAEEFNVTNSTFTNCDIVYSYRGDVTFYNCNATATWLYMENQDAISETVPFTVTVSECNFTDQNSQIAAIHLENYKVFQIEENTIDGYYVGLQLMGTGSGSGGNQNIRLNEIKNGYVGINAYNTTSVIKINNIHNNDFGIKINNNCNTNLEGNPLAGNWSQTQQIIDNNSYELYFSSGSFPWNFQYNVVVDEDNAGNPTDPMVYYQPPSGGGQILDVRNNCWGNSFNPADDFYGGIYYYLPVWNLPELKSATINVDSAKALYMHAKEEFDSAYYISAKASFMQVINQYSITKFASAAMKDLFSLEQFENNNYQWLKNYYQTDSIIQNDTILEDLSGFLANKCEVQLQNWQTAINHYEAIILNPETFEDSIYAVIDLGQLYILMQNSNSREVVQGKLLELIPGSKMGFINNRNYLLSLLPEKKTTNQDLPENTILKAGELMQNQPNPFSGKTTIQYKLRKGGFVKIKVFSQSGSIVKSLEFEKDAGTHSAELNLQDLSNGIYFYSLEINGIRTDTKKMVLVK